MLLLDQCLLLFRRLDQQRGETVVVHSDRVLAVLLPGHHLGNDRADFFGDHSDFVLAGLLQVVRDASQLLDRSQGPVQRLDIGFEAPGTAGNPVVRIGGAGALSDRQDVGGCNSADADVDRVVASTA